MKQMFIQKEKRSRPGPVAGNSTPVLFSLKWFILLIGLSAFAPVVSFAATITGKVTGDSAQALSNVSVQVKGSTRGTTTNEQGEFSIEASSRDVLVISYVGYATKEVAVGNQTEINITLTTAGQELQQVVVVGYGTQRKVDVTGSVAQVSSAEINKQPTPNPISALQGKVAGVQITNSGAPGASPQIRIRGLGTVYGDPNPLYVVDGVWYDDISFLNPADIENISILKDASSESIYGIRAANGVVLVTTKKGRSGQPSVNYTGYVGVQSVTNQVKMANAGEYATLINEKLLYSGGDSLIHNPAQYGKGTNWYDVIFRNAIVTNHQVSISGAGEKSSYNFSLGYYDQQGIVKTNDFKRYTARIQNDIQVLNPLKIGFTAVATHINSDDINGSIFNQTFNAPAIVPVRYADGTYGDPGDYGLGVTVANPQVTLDYFNQKSITNRVTGNVYADLKFAQHFTYHFSMGGEYGEGQVAGYTPVYNATTTQNNSVSSLAITRSETRNWILENTLTYTNKFGDHNLTVLAGQGSQRNQYNEIHASVQNISDTAALQYLSLGTASTARVYDLDPNNPQNPGYPLLSTINSYFGRVNYSFKNRYLVNASLRADGSSKFYGNDRWGYFPSIGAGWVISEEPFMQNQKVFSNVKLRGSWGRVGNANVPLNLSVLRVSQTPGLTAIFGGQPYTGASINTIVPPTTNWELSEGVDIGLEASVIDKRLSVEADYYNRKTKNAIFAIPVLSSIGTSSGNIIGNQATFQNEGFEFTASWRDNAGKDFSYSISGNVSLNNNKVLSTITGSNPIYGGGGASTGGALATRTLLGQPIGEFFGRQVIGIFQSQTDIDNYVSKSGALVQPDAKPGDFKYADVNGDGQITDQDRVVLGNPNPKYSYGINTSFRYREFDISLDFQGVADVDIYNAVNALRYGNENYTKDFYDHRWHGEGTSNTYPSADLGGGKNYLPNSFFVQSGSYFRVRNAQVGYTLPSALMNRWHTKSLRVYVNAQNPLNFFKYKGFSPEVGGSPTNAGIDTNVYPLYATYNLGVNLTF